MEKQPTNKKKVAKRNLKSELVFRVGLGMGLLAFALAGSLPSHDEGTSQVSQEAAFGILQPTTTAKDEIESFYPELASFSPTEDGLFATSATTTRWINFTENSLNVESMGKILNFFEDRARQGMSGNLNIISGEQVVFTVNPPMFQYSNKLYFIESQMPNPYWADLSNEAITLSSTNYPLNLTRIKIVDTYKNRPAEMELYNSSADYATSNFMTEACQASARVSVSNSDYKHEAQEMFCTSMSLAFYLSSRDKSYGEYAQFAGKGSTSTMHGTFAFILVPRETYLTFPSVGSIFKNK